MKDQRRPQTLLLAILSPVFVTALGPLGTFLCLAALAAIWLRPAGRFGASTTHGTARFAKPADLVNAIRRHGSGPLLHIGRMIGHGIMVQLPKFAHLGVFIGTGGGKGTGLIIPSLFRCPSNTVVFDPKGENYKLTAEYRRKVLGHQVYLIDPFGVCGSASDCLNSFGFVDQHSRYAVDHCRALTASLSTRTGKESTPFFEDMAEGEALLGMLAVMSKGVPAAQSLNVVADLLANPELRNNALKAALHSTAFDGILARVAGQQSHLEGREKASVAGTVTKNLQFLNSPNVMAITKTSTFDPLWLRSRKCDLFIVLPPNMMNANAGLIRYLLTGIFLRLTSEPPSEANEILFHIDEAALLGRLPIMEEAISLFRGWGLRIISYWQSLGQLQDCFPGEKATTYLANVAQIYGSVRDYATAEKVSKMLGDATVFNTSVQSGESYSRAEAMAFDGNTHPPQRSTSSSTTHAEMGRALLKPDEVMNLPDRTMIVFAPNVPPIMVEQVRYYDPDFVAGREHRRRGGKLSLAQSLLIVAALILAVVLYQKHEQRNRIDFPVIPTGGYRHD